jgi:CubicO group peptidase (beta-lactamase class C family)
MKPLILLMIPLSVLAQPISNIDSLFTDYKDSSPGAALYVERDGDVVFNNSYGLANRETGEKVTSTTNFRLASVTKQFTAAAVLQLCDFHKIPLVTKSNAIFPEFPSEYGEVTIWHLLTHTSGIWDYENLVDDSVKIQVKDKDVLDLLMEKNQLYFAPGDSFRYSNSGYAILKLMIEKLSGMTYAAYLEKNVFSAGEMLKSVAYEKGVSTVVNRAYGYKRIEGDKWERKDQSSTSAVLGDGGIYSSTDDLLRWLKHYFNGDIIRKELVDEATSRKVLNNGGRFDYGYGWRLKQYKGLEVVYHTGSTTGGRTIIYTVPEKDIFIVILCNRNEGDTVKMAETIVEFLLIN